MKRIITIEIEDAEQVTLEELTKLITETLQKRGGGKSELIPLTESMQADDDEVFSPYGRAITRDEL